MNAGNSRTCLGRQKMREKDHRKNTQAKTADPLNKTGTQSDEKHKKHMYAAHKITSLGEYITGQMRKQDSMPHGIGCFAAIVFQNVQGDGEPDMS